MSDKAKSTYFLCSFLILFGAIFNITAEPVWRFGTFQDWYNNCLFLNKYRELYSRGFISDKTGMFKNVCNYSLYRGLNIEEFERAIHQFFVVQKEQLLVADSWLDQAPQAESDFLALQKHDCFKPYTQKLVVTAGAEISFHGDLHGDVHSLLAHIKKLQDDGYMDPIDGFKIKPDKNFYIIFLGDYVDRGVYGTEVLYTLMRLKIANPQKVILVRGNHEDPELTEAYGFNAEFTNKFESPLMKLFLNKLQKFYNLLPVVLYLGYNNNFLQCCHGGLEIGYKPHELLNASYTITYQWLGILHQKANYAHLKETQACKCTKMVEDYFVDYTPTHPMTYIRSINDYASIGFMWNDFETRAYDSSVYSGRGFTFNRDFTMAVLQDAQRDNAKLMGIIRAHQHSPSNRDPLMYQLFASHGAARLWQKNIDRDFNFYNNIVITLLLSPDSLYGQPDEQYTGFTYDTSLLVKPHEEFSAWSGQVSNIDIYPPADK